MEAQREPRSPRSGRKNALALGERHDLDRIEARAAEIPDDLRSWHPRVLRAALADDLLDLGATAAAAIGVITFDAAAEVLFRSLLTAAAGYEYPDTFAEGEVESALPLETSQDRSDALAPSLRADEEGLSRSLLSRSGAFLTATAFLDLQFAAALIAEDEGDWVQMNQGIASLFERAEWVEALCSAATDEAGDDGHFRILLDLYAREWDEPLLPEPWQPSRQVMASATYRRGRRSVRHPHRRGRTRPPKDLRSRERRLCVRRMRSLGQQYRAWADTHRPSARVAFADGISGVSPAQACAGELVRITGSGFGAQQPSNIRLMFPSGDGCREVAVDPSDWTDTEIRVRIPAWVRGGCVGFFDQAAFDAVIAYREALGKQRSRLQSVAAGCGVKSRPGGKPRPPDRCPPCTPANVFLGTIPEIDAFSGNGEADPVIAPDGTVTLSWRVRNVSTLRLQRQGGPGPNADLILPAGALVTGLHQLDFAVDRDGDPVYRLTATNRCGIVTADVRVHVRMPTQVTIHGIEVIQVVQTFEPDDSGASNNVFLVEGKRTLIRAYLDSGLPADYNVIGGRGGSLPCDEVAGFAARAKIRTTPLSSQAGVYDPPLDLLKSGVVMTADELDRLRFDDTLNFELPLDRSHVGNLRLTLRVFPSDPYASWLPVQSSIDVTFNPSPKLDLVILRVRDNYRSHAETTYAEAWDGISEIETMYPVAGEVMGGLRLWSTGNDMLETDLDFDDERSWYNLTSLLSDDLFDLIEEIAEEYEDNGEIWCAVVPPGAVTANAERHGYGTWAGPWWHRKAAWVAMEKTVAPHELGHVMHYYHDEKQIGIVGCDISAQEIIPATTKYLMWSGERERWPDRAFHAGVWIEMFNIHGVGVTWT